MIDTIWQQFVEGMKHTTVFEYIAVASGIASVWYSRKENILVYPVGLISTVIYIWLSFKGHLFGEAAVNFYYTVMSIYGWWLWAKKDQNHQQILHISYSNTRWIIYQLLFFAGFYLALYISLYYLKQNFTPGAIPWADSLAAATAFTGMWLMAKKKIESWYWWIATNIASVPLYFVKQYVFTSVFYVVLLIMAFYGLAEWKRRVKLR
ncbi:nicotinamide riboside transporter PnuC [Lacibacter sediminis]|uniref:Nicotinamide riboside transporter PnuC n=1 Tax=Lacibacter sediminis TaxID=2760713 RepID=A0A7G5XGY7_9BACT|nr:nicotinamide riboside transporter PnuC [Lacibacter sediminis]QNA44740.1 nicotinamide mononucleotide transporter [Lacibacter sediminis]